MTFAELRNKHQFLCYKDYHAEIKNNVLVIEHQFILEPDINFKPRLEIPLESNKVDLAQLDRQIFHLGLIETLSYWKAACPKEIIIEAGHLNDEQIAWYKKLLKEGLSEFFFVNKIDPTNSELVSIIVNAKEKPTNVRATNPSGDLILVGGGKDSCTTLEILKDSPKKRTLMLNPIPASLKTASLISDQEPIILKRRIDPKLLELNSLGYLNGHTPFSAYLAFASTLVAKIYNYKNIIASNESSANEGNTTIKGSKVNHQYSKSFDFEKDFSTYLSRYLDPEIRYFSFLRPLLDLQITSIFSKHEKFFTEFKSCNVNHKKDSWCEKCSKCAFVYLCLFPFIDQKKLKLIFSSDLFKNREILKEISALVGLTSHKPLECVGTLEESREALRLSIEKYQKANQEIPKGLMEIYQQIPKEKTNLLHNHFNQEHMLPETYLKTLKSSIANHV